MILPVLVLFFSAELAQSLYEGDSCDLTSGNSGVCTALNNCRSVLEKLKLGNSPDLVCGYLGYEPIVCCPRSTPTNIMTAIPVESENGTGAIARQKCAEYSKYVYTLKPAPVSHPAQHLLNVSQCGVSVQTTFGSNNRRAGPTEFPYVAAIGYDLENGHIGWHCGGTLISETFVLTAAHCTYLSEWGKATWVHLGSIFLARSEDGVSPVDRRIAERIVHPEFRPPRLYHDIALLRLESRVPFNDRIRPACLHTTSSTGTQFAIVTGWGRADPDGSRNLRRDRLRLVDSQTCNANWTSGTMNKELPDGVVANWSICATAEDRDTCQGDAGGPLVIFSKQEFYCMYDVAGVKGFGKLCNGQYPGLYTRVYYYLRWIESEVWGRG